MAKKLPTFRLSIERVERDESEAGIATEVAGLALIVFCAMAVLLGNAAGLDRAPLDALRACFALGSAATLVVTGLLDTRVHAIFKGLVLAGVGSAGCSLVTACLFVYGWVGGTVGTAIASGAGALLGVCAALIALYWSIAYARMETLDIVLGSGVAVALSSVLFELSVWLLPRAALQVAVCLLPLANVALLRNRVTNRLPDVELRDALYFSELKIDRWAFAAKIVPTMLAFGTVTGTLALHIADGPQAGGPAHAANALVAAVACCAVALWARSTIRRRDVTYNQVFRMLVPLLAVLALPLVFAESGELTLSEASVNCDLALCIALAWLFHASIAQDFRLSPLFVFGLGMASLILGMLGSCLFMGTVAEQVGEVLSPRGLSLVVCLFALVVVSGFFPRAVDIHAIVSKSFSPEELRGGTCGTADPDRADGEMGAPGAVVEPAVRPASGDPERDEADQARRKGRFLRRCECVADTFLLSRRETDVLVLLAKGRNVGYIKEQLCISEGTAKTHVHHVYKKLCVHSQQELIALVDSIRVE